MTVVGAAVVVALVVVIVIGVTSSGNHSSPTRDTESAGDPGVLTTFEQACQRGQYSLDASVSVPGATSSVVCDWGDSAEALSSLYVLSSPSQVEVAINTLSRPENGFSCFVVGQNWVAQAQSEAGTVTLAEDAQSLQSTLGGEIRGSC